VRAIELVDNFGTAGLKPGLYVAASDEDAFGPLLALIETGGATFLGENIDTRGRKIVAASVGARRNPSIGISREFFTTVLKDYDDWPEKWWREAIQNSVDAGATSIKCTVVENPDGTWSVSMEDNGGGMSEDVLINKFLMLGGTTKVGTGGTSGGFGKAKELLILPWVNWEVHTRDRVVKGSGIDYVVENAQNIHGTKVTVVMPADQHTTGAAAIAFIQKCYLPNIKFQVKATFQEGQRDWDKPIRAVLKAKDLLESVPGKAEAYVTKVDYTPSSMLIRTNGLYMFSQYIGNTPKKQVIVEITAPSIQILTANRDGFRDYDVRRAVGALGERVAKDILSALQAKSGIIRQKYEGAGKFKARQRQAEVLSNVGPIGPTTRGVVFLPEAEVAQLSRVVEDIRLASPGNPAIPNQGLATELLTNTVYHGAHHIEEAVRQLVWEPDFFLINEIEDYRVPKKFKPETMAPRVTKLVRTWTELCRYVLMQLGNFREYGVGLIFSEHKGAAYLHDADEHWLLLNPYKDVGYRTDTWSPTKKNDLKWLYAAAVHECTHLADGIEYHDESFAAALTNNIAKTADGFKYVSKIVSAIRMRDEAIADVLRRDNPTTVTQIDLVGRLKF
jgi:hypothetical protein